MNPSLWETALRDAAGILASYITPPEYGIASVAVKGVESDPDCLFRYEIQRRLDFGRALAFSEALDEIESEITTSYRHKIFLCRDTITGHVHIPRLLMMRAQRANAPIPVIRASRQLVTPENLLISELTARSLRVTRSWQRYGGREAILSAEAASRLRQFEAEDPWRDLRSHPRPTLLALCRTVRDRIKSGIVSKEPFSRLLDLFDPKANASTAFERAAAVLVLPLTSDPAFEDRLFELLCLAWIIAPMVTVLKDVRLWPTNLKGAAGKPLIEARLSSGTSIRVFYQTGLALPTPAWKYVPSERPLGGIIDILLEVGDAPAKIQILIDAKNRSGDETQVFYKMIGYKANFFPQTKSPYRGVAIFPSLDETTRIKAIVSDDHTVWMLRLPLMSGRDIISTLMRGVLSSAA